jgi:hypothetical protein
MFSRPAIIRESVDLPQPDGPNKDYELPVINIATDPVQHLRGAERLADVAD